MKTKLLLITFLVLSFSALSQSKNKISFLHGIATNELLRIAVLDGTGHNESKGATIFGINYQRQIKENLYLESGFEYSINKFLVYPSIDPTLDRIPTEKEINMIRIPIYLNYSGKYLFANGGAIIDYEIEKLSDESNNKQTGLGFGIGIGGKYDYRNFEIYINPFLSIHTVIPIENNNWNEYLLEGGIKFGIAYLF